MHALTASRRAAVAALLALGLAGCRDLALPSPPTSPTLAGFSPPAAWAGQLLRVTGSHFDPDPAANTVHFAGASARCERWDGGDLLVRVPADAGDGPITVANRDGTSVPSAAAFDYLGAGELRRMQVMAAEPILHHPLRVHAVAGSVLVESSLLRLDWTQRHGLVQYGASTAFPEAVSASAVAPWRGELVATADDATGTTLTIWPMDGSGPPRLHRLAGIRPWRILAARPAPSDPAQDLLVTFQLVGAEETIRTWRLDESTHVAHDHSGTAPPPDLPSVLGSTPLGLEAVAGPCDVQDGRIVLVARNPATSGGRLAVVSLATGGVLDFVDPPGSHVLSYDGGDRYFDGLAAGPRFEGTGHVAAVALDEGWVMLVDLDDLASPPDTFLDLVPTYSTARVSGMALASMGGTGARTIVVSTKPADDLVLGIDTVTASVAWGLPTRGARRVAAIDTLAWVANDADNELQVVNVATARQVGRLAFDVAPGAFDSWGDPDPAGGLAFAPADPADPSSVDTLYLVAGSPPSLLEIPLDTAEPPSTLLRDEALGQVAWDATHRVPWGLERARYADPLRAVAFDGTSPSPWAGNPPSSFPIAGATQARRIAFTPAGAIVAHDAGLTALAGAVTGAIALAAPTWGTIGAAPGDLTWVTGTWDGADHAQLWSQADVAAGGPPTAEWSTTSTYVWWGAWLEDGLWVYTWDLASPPAMVRLEADGSALAPAASVTPANPANLLPTAPAALSPNLRTLAMWEYRGADTALRFFSADPAKAFAELGYVPIEGTITGAAFDEKGERLYVLTQNPDRIVTVD